MNAENYQALNEKLSQAFSDAKGFPLKVRAFENSMFAGYDLCFGLLQFLSHRPKVGIVRLGTSLPESLLPHFYRLQTPIVFKKETEIFLQYIAQLDSELNFVLWSAENEMTGEVFISEANRLEIHKALSAKRIFSIEVRAEFSSGDIEVLKQSAYSIIIEAGTLFNKDRCLIYHTDKLKTPSLIGHYQDHLKSLESYLVADAKTDNTALLKKVADLKLNYFNRFSTATVTLMDRIVLASSVVAGSALKAELNLSAQQAFAPSDLPSWVLESIQAWWPEAKNTDLLLGLLIVNLSQLNDQQLAKIFDCHDRLAEQSAWSIS